jgi:hypothetical protein
MPCKEILTETRVIDLQKVEPDARTCKSAETKKRKKRSISVKRWIRLKDGTKVEIPNESFTMLTPLYDEKPV